MNHVDKKNKCFTEDYKVFYPFIFSSVCRKLKNADEAVEVCQEVFVRYYIKYDEIINARNWLVGTARNVIFEYCRKKVRLEGLCGQEIPIEQPVSSGQFENRIMLKELYEDDDVFRNDKERILFELRGLYGYSLKEVADCVNLTERQVRYRFSLIQKRIEVYLKCKGIKHMEDLL